MKPPRAPPRPASDPKRARPKGATLPLGTRAPSSGLPDNPASSPSAQARAKAMVGRVISDRYRIDELVAMGGMGAVYRGEHLLMRKQVAIKVLHPEIEDFPELVARFEREAVAGAHIVHTNVASASDFGKFDGESYFLVLEYIRGATLSDVMRRGPVPPARAAKIAKQIAAALGAAHAKRIVHRDVKPRNVMLVEGEDDLVKLIDFGLARVPVGNITPVAQDEGSDRRSLTGAGVVFGTVAYMAPETALGMGAVEARSDLYALGVILYEMLAGKHPFDATDPAQLFAQHRYDVPPPLRIRNPSVVVPDALEAVVKRLLEKDPNARYPDAAAVIAALEEAMPVSSAISTPVPSDTADLPITVLGLRPDTDSPAPDPPAAAAEIPQVKPYVPRLLDKRAQNAGDRSRLWMGVAIVAVGVAAFSLFARRDPERSSSVDVPPVPSAPASPEPRSLVPAATAATAGATGTAVGGMARPSGNDALSTLRAAAASDVASAARALIEIAAAEPKSFRDLDVQAAAAKIADRALAAGGRDADRVGAVLAHDLGSDGLDVLYEVVHTGGPGAPRAAAILSPADVLSRATPAMRVAFDLHRASCQHKPNLFPRAGAMGDGRALEVMTRLQPPACDPMTGACCFRKHGELDKAIAAIKARTGL